MSIRLTSIFKSFKKENNHNNIKNTNKLKDTAIAYSNKKPLQEQINLLQKDIDNCYTKKESITNKQQKYKSSSKKFEKYEFNISLWQNSIDNLKGKLDTPTKLINLQKTQARINQILSTNKTSNSSDTYEALNSLLDKAENTKNQLKNKLKDLITQKDESTNRIRPLNNHIILGSKNKENKKKLEQEQLNLKEIKEEISTIDKTLYNDTNNEKLDNSSSKKNNENFIQHTKNTKLNTLLDQQDNYKKQLQQLRNKELTIDNKDRSYFTSTDLKINCFQEMQNNKNEQQQLQNTIKEIELQIETLTKTF